MFLMSLNVPYRLRTDRILAALLLIHVGLHMLFANHPHSFFNQRVAAIAHSWRYNLFNVFLVTSMVYCKPALINTMCSNRIKFQIIWRNEEAVVMVTNNTQNAKTQDRYNTICTKFSIEMAPNFKCKSELVDMYDHLIMVIGADEGMALRWLETPKLALDNKCPLDLVHSCEGIMKVTKVLRKALEMDSRIG